MYLRPIARITPNGEAVGVNWTKKMICLALATTWISPAAILAAKTQADVPLKSPIRRTSVSECRNDISQVDGPTVGQADLPKHGNPRHSWPICIESVT